MLVLLHNGTDVLCSPGHGIRPQISTVEDQAQIFCTENAEAHLECWMTVKLINYSENKFAMDEPSFRFCCRIF
jgi:hypothetical protein